MAALMPNSPSAFDPNGICLRCGHPHPKCAAHNRSGAPCSLSTEPSQQVCRLHGGRAPQNLDAAERREQMRAARELATTYGVRVEVNPIDSMLEQVYWSAGHIAWLRDVVQSLTEDELVWGVANEVQREGGGDKRTSADFEATSVAAPNVWIQLYRDERRLHMDMCLGMIRAGIEERRVRLAEQQGQAVAALISRIADTILAALTSAGMAGTFVPVFRTALAEAAPRELRALGAA